MSATATAAFVSRAERSWAGAAAVTVTTARLTNAASAEQVAAGSAAAWRRGRCNGSSS